MSADARVNVNGVEVPTFLYGTAWKEERTEARVLEALAAGFRGFDTANQRRHYHEAGVGEALRRAMAAGDLARDSLFLQTKYTYREGQDSRLPYDPAADYPTQVRQSLQSSLEHLGVERIDSFLLHGPRTRAGLSEIDREVWAAMEDLQREGVVRLIGISNITAEQLALLCRVARVRPAFVQNRCYARLGWDRDVREVCRSEGVHYQGFSLLTANLLEIGSPEVGEIAARHGRTANQVIFRAALQLGMICLTGTTSPEHMAEALDVHAFRLDDEEVAVVERISG
ncbi:MAG TPA: aldo/keto reductase [Thermoanaerobaculia bacterium]|nr:aldo/keto reductase [Thermoanaerobaculia bacterium]